METPLMDVQIVDALLKEMHSLPIADNKILNLSHDQIMVPERTLSELYPKFTLDDMRKALWEVFSRGIVVTDAQLGKFSRSDLLRYHDICLQIIEAGFFIANAYLKTEATRTNFIKGPTSTGNKPAN
jgi:hypothetical protein